MLKKIIFLLALLPTVLFGQRQLSGYVFDSKTGEPLPYATIITNTQFGELTDREGQFVIKTYTDFSAITISYVGYKKLTVPIDTRDRFIRIALEPAVENLGEVLITARENPALRIIRQAIENRSENNIEKVLQSYRYNAYNKTLVTGDPDSISSRIDTVFTLVNGERVLKRIDSTNFKFRKELEKHHLFISEKISAFQFQRGKKRKELVLASRMAGFKQPIYELLAFTIQDYSVYKDEYTLVGTRYINPIARNALRHYTYKILDTVPNAKNSSYMIYFKPKDQKEFAGLEGVLYLDTERYAVTGVIAEIKAGINVKATQGFTYLEEEDLWFPDDLEVLIRKGENFENIRLFGTTIFINPPKERDSLVNTQTRGPEDIIHFISQTTHSDIEINVPVSVKQASATLEFTDDVARRDEAYWNRYRTDSLTRRGRRAYTVLDSIVAEENVEQKLDLARTLIKGYFPTKYVNLDLGKIINLNNYEGLRIGMGGVTNSNFSPLYRLESYLAYGTKDDDFKYSLGAAARVDKRHNTWLGVGLTNDLKEAASLDFIAENRSFSVLNPRNLNIEKFYNYRKKFVYLEHDIKPNLETRLELSHGDYKPVFDYQYIYKDKISSAYVLTMAALGFQYNPGSEYMYAPVGKLRMKNAFPQFTFQLLKSFENVWSGEFDFTQINLRIRHRIKPVTGATTHVLVEGGLVWGDAPITHLFNSVPNYTYKQPWLKRVNFAGVNSFETMGYNEFLSDRYAAIHIKHELRPFRLSARFKPQMTLVTRATVGSLEKPYVHYGLVFQSPQKGYFESGLEFNSLFKGFGLSAFLRYGAYWHEEWSDNIALKLTYKIRLGI
jgi:hypothetical protein